MFCLYLEIYTENPQFREDKNQTSNLIREVEFGIKTKIE